MKEDNVEILAYLPYMKVIRTIEDNHQYHKEEEHKIILSSERIQTSFDTFLLEEVLDISYRVLSQEMGLLYLHTIRGMYSFTVRTSPHLFIKEFKKIK